MTTVQTLPHWDMGVVYPSMESREFQVGFARVVQDIQDLAELFDAHAIEKREHVAINDELVKAFESVLQRYNEVMEESRTLITYITCFVTTNTLDRLAQAKMSEIQQASVILSQLGTRFSAWIGSLDVEALIGHSPMAQAHAFMLRKARVRAAPMNSIKGEVNVLSRRRGWESPLEASLVDNNIDRQTLDAMMTAAHESFPDFRRYLRAKARALGLERLAWYDLFAPIGSEDRVWSFDESASCSVEQFGAYSARLADFAARAFREHWIDAEPRAGKIDGACCAWLRRDESRVFANYKAAFSGVSTLAHELGHAYHNLNLVQRTMLQRSTPMTLAETASIFCETIIRNAALHNAGKQ